MNIPIQLAYVPPRRKPGKRWAFLFMALVIFVATGFAAEIIHGGAYALF